MLFVNVGRIPEPLRVIFVKSSLINEPNKFSVVNFVKFPIVIFLICESFTLTISENVFPLFAIIIFLIYHCNYICQNQNDSIYTQYYKC